MTDRIKISGGTAVAIAASLERRLLAGGATAGGALPPIRRLATSLKVSPATVAAAYKLLRARGLTAGGGRRGTRVSAASGARSNAPPSLPPGARDLATGNPDGSLLPVLGQALRSLQVESRLFGGMADRTGLLAFASSEFEADRIPAHAMAVLSGGLDAIERLLREHLRAGDRVAVEDPSFPGIIDLVASSGYQAVPVAIDDEGPVPDRLAAALARGCQAFVVTPRAQNPTGAAVSDARAQELRRVLRRFPPTMLIENDYAGPVAGAPMHSLRVDGHERWAVVRSVSKWLGPDLRVAVVAGDEVTIARVRARHAMGARWVSQLLQQLVLELWSDPAGGRRLARAEEAYALRRNAVLAALSARGIEAHGRSGFNVWVPVRDEGRVVRGLADRGWAVAAGERFRIKSGPGIRVTVSTLAPDEAERFTRDLAAALSPAEVGFA